MKLIFFVVIFIVSTYAKVTTNYDNYKVYRLFPTTDEHLKHLRYLEKNDLEYDMWQGPTKKDNPVDIMVSPQKSTKFLNDINRNQIKYEVYIENVQRLIDGSTPSSKDVIGFNWKNYQDLNNITSWLTNLTERFPDFVSLINVGRTYQGRNITGVRISYKERNKAVFLEGGIHAREWISPATVTFILNELLTNQDPDVRDIVENYDWYVFPVVNPDGYVYTFTEDRLWRKTVDPHGEPTRFECIGADMIRNWNFHFMEEGANNNTCSEIYAGPFAFSETEAKTLAEFVGTIQSNLVGYITFHSYSQILLIPYGHERCENFDELMEIGTKAIQRLTERHGTNYTVGNIKEILYVTSGVSMDWVKSTYSIPITFSYELRDTGKNGFILPPEQIIPTGEETFDSLVTMMQEARARGH